MLTRVGGRLAVSESASVRARVAEKDDARQSRRSFRSASISRLVLVASLVLVAVALPWPTRSAHAQPSYWLFESGPTRPLALSSDRTRLYAVNTPDAHLEVWDVSGAVPTHVGSIPVGLEPVAVALRNDGEAWVVNHLSDSVSIVDLAATPPRVVRTLLVGDGPEDVVFAGTALAPRAFITTAHRGQNTSDPRGGYATEGIGRADVWVFDPAAANDALAATPITIVSLFSDRPRALAVSPDGSTVYAAGFMSGNRTTTIPEDAICPPETVGTCTVPQGTSPGALPPPARDHNNQLGPPTGLIVRYDETSSQWRDELGRDWSSFVQFSLPDYDVFRIDANAATPIVTDSLAGVGTVLFGMVVNPSTGKLYVSNTEANNRVRFEGDGTYVTNGDFKPAGEPVSVRGHLHEARITVVDGSTVTPRRLNTHLNYAANPQPLDARGRSFATPMGMAISGNGQTLYVAAFGSQALGVIPVSALESGTYVPDASTRVPLSAGGPTGLVLDETGNRAFVATRFDDGISVVSLTTKLETAHVRNHDPEPASVIYGRPLLYDAQLSSSTGEAACGSCHVFGDVDGLAWDLGDPDGNLVANPNPVGPVGFSQPFSPLKGPMTTQTFRGIDTHGPMHWRGDRSGALSGGSANDEHAAFVAFGGAFAGLLGRDEGPLDPTRMARFADFATQLTMPPNPIRQLDNTLRVDEARGHDLYFNRDPVDTVSTCNGCHVLNPAAGFFGTSGLTTFENETQEMKVAHLRNLYDKVGMFGMSDTDFFNGADHGFMGPQVRGFGFLHDGSTDTVLRFLRASVFTGLNSEGERSDIETFMMSFDSDLAPIVGQQVTIDPGSDAAELARMTLLHTRAGTAFTLPGNVATTECDLVAQGVVAGEARGFRRLATGGYTSDRASEPERSFATLAALAAMAGNQLTFTCAPPGSGVRMALDRDEDGVRNRDELDASTDPIDRPFPAPPVDATPDAGVMDASSAVDAASDAATDAGPARRHDSGCGCRVGGSGPSAPSAPLLLGLVGLVGLLLTRRANGRARRDIPRDPRDF